MTCAGRIGRWAALVGAGLLCLLAAGGCAGSTNAAAASSLVRARPTTPPATFALQMSGTVAGLADALDRLAGLFQNPRYLDETWKSEAVNLSTLVELGYRQLEGLAPPHDSQEKHAAAVRALQDCQTLTVYVFQGINNLDKGPFDEVKQRVDFCRDRLKLAVSAPGSIQEQRQPQSIEAARLEVQVRIKRDANLRAGPGTRFPVAATAKLGDTFTVTGRTAKGDWLQVTNAKVKDAWIAAFLLESGGDLSSVAVVDQPISEAGASASADQVGAAASGSPNQANP